MAFNIAKSRQFKETVKFADDEDGNPQSMNVTFRVVQDDVTSAVDFRDKEQAIQFLVDAIKDVDDLVTEGGKPVPYSEDILRQFAVDIDVRNAMNSAYSRGLLKAGSGN